MQLKRKPERWDDLDPWIALGTAVTLQAHQDLVKGAKLARIILSGVEGRRRARAISAFRERQAWTAAEFFRSSPIWAYFAPRICDGGLPPKVREAINDVLECAEVLGITEGDENVA